MAMPLRAFKAGMNALLGMVNRDDPRIRHLSGYAEGGRPSGREWSGSEYRAQVTVQGHTVNAPSLDYDRLADEGVTA